MTRWRTWALVAVFGVGAVLRCIHLAAPPLEFHAARQYHSALLTRAYTIALGLPVTTTERRAAEAAKPAEIEPPILEVLHALLFRLIGHETLSVPRAVSGAFWLVAGLFVFALTRRIAGERAGVIAAGLHLLIPYGVAASRSFQPETLYIVATLGTAYALVRRAESGRSLVHWTTVIGGAFAVFAKLPAGFYVGSAALGTSTSVYGRRGVLRRQVWSFLALIVAPTVVYLVLAYFVFDFLRGQVGGRVLPSLLFRQWYWHGWYEQLSYIVGLPLVAIVGLPLVALAIATLLFSARSPARNVLLGLWAGYVAFGLTFTYHYATHDYYHLPLIPLTACGVGAAAGRALARVRDRKIQAIAVVALSAIPISALLKQANNVDIFDIAPDASNAYVLADAERIGELVKHSTRVVFLDYWYGGPLQYYGILAGVPWPTRFDLFASRLRNERQESTEERLARFRREGAEYFVVTYMAEWRAQPDLRQALRRASCLVAENARYLVFDLQCPQPQGLVTEVAGVAREQ